MKNGFFPDFVSDSSWSFIITHCNGASGYIPPAEVYKEGDHEVTNSRFEIGSAEILEKRAIRILYDLYNQAGSN